MITLVTGGSRSGKSAFAQQLAERLTPPRLFLATCPRIDTEMDERIDRHQRDREGRGWETVEEPLLLAQQLGRAPAGVVVLVDCLTLWTSNLMHEAELSGQALDEEHMGLLAEQLALAARRQGPTIFVTGEVGLGIVPDNPMARRFRDLVGRCNQTIAAVADEVFLVCCGIPVQIKGKPQPRGECRRRQGKEQSTP